MADSLRDQLIAAGFEAPKKPEKKSHNKKRKPAPKKAAKKTAGSGNVASKRGSENAATADEEARARKKLKAQIKDLIDNNKFEDWKGEITYRYLVDKRIRELYVNKNAHKLLTAREAAVTRLNGDTYLVPLAVAVEIKKITPQWSVFNTDKDEDTKPSGDDDYSEFQVPDDLQW